MSDLLDKYKTDKETKLKIAEEELQKSQSQNTQLMKEKNELLAKIKAQINNCNANEKVKIAITQAMKNEVEKVSIPPTMSPNIKTPSPESYLDIMNTFAKPSIPLAPRMSSILKTSRRTLLPPEFQKRVVFKPLTSTRDYTSGESSSDAYALEAADSDESFEEIRRVRRYPNIRPEIVPRASVAPFLPKITTPQKIPSSHNEHNMNNEVNRGPPANSSKRKRESVTGVIFNTSILTALLCIEVVPLTITTYCSL
ncbi:hypothetical protein E2C01_011872 [Portunus trituberculatus]|uniref:Uncharacterized protein n=1 Tax=Portunus trituberculatus TaxID=210409 RepID=A0A5B7DC96_PORTR|nr:hypothetical protein [Portunus trituberculatus]